jgi:hypothetical protein
MKPTTNKNKKYQKKLNGIIGEINKNENYPDF